MPHPAFPTENCPECSRPLQWRPAAKPPILSQVLFGVSFALLVARDFIPNPKLALSPVFLWSWTGLQIALGAWVVWGRLQANRRVLVCIPCKLAVGSRASED